MEKKLLELSIEEFVRVSCRQERIYTIGTLYQMSEDQKPIIGTYTQIYMALLMESKKNETAEMLLRLFEQTCFSFDIEVNSLDIYDYLEYKTNGFQKEKSLILLSEMESTYNTIILNERTKIKWYRAYKPDDSMYYEAINLLKTKIDALTDEARCFYEDKTQQPQPENLSKPISSNILPSKLIDAMIAQNLAIRSGNGLKWVQSASLYGYFIDLVTRKLNLRASNGRIKWKDFGFIENHASLLSTARQAVNDYTNKGLNPPEGDDIVDRLLK